MVGRFDSDRATISTATTVIFKLERLKIGYDDNLYCDKVMIMLVEGRSNNIFLLELHAWTNNAISISFLKQQTDQRNI
jgi:hypothetical protein